MKKTSLLTLFCVFTLAVTALAAPPVFQLRLVADKPSTDTEKMTQTHRQADQIVTQVFNVQKTILLDQTALQSAKATTDGLKQPVVDIKLTEAGAKKFAAITRQNLHKQVAIIIDGQLREAPTVQSEISGGEIQISGRFTEQETQDLAKKINDAAGKK